jgi:hypothetical protein
VSVSDPRLAGDTRFAVRVPLTLPAIRSFRTREPNSLTLTAHALASRYPLAGLPGLPSFLLRTLPYVFGVRVTFWATTTGSPANGGNFQRMAVF